MRPLLVGWVLLVILNLSLHHVCDLKHAEEQTKVRIRAGNEPSRSLKFHNHREDPSPTHLKDTIKKCNAKRYVNIKMGC